jgi:hypothetical protein
MKAIQVPKKDRYIFLEAARIIGIDFTRLNKVLHPTMEYFHTDKFNLSQNDLFQLGILYQQMKINKTIHHESQ